MCSRDSDTVCVDMWAPRTVGGRLYGLNRNPGFGYGAQFRVKVCQK